MVRYIKTALLAAGLIILMVGGCTDRAADSVKPGPRVAEGGVSPQTHVFFQELLFQIDNDYQLLKMAVYVPKVSFPNNTGGELKPVPLLLLLPPQNADEFYFFNHGLADLADDLIADGSIEPMAIACIQNDPIFGGYFYASGFSSRYEATFYGAPYDIVSASAASGDWDAIVGNSLITYLQRVYPIILDDSTKRGIGGVGMGAYGAYRAAILNAGVFTSISTTDGPLDFDGNDGSGGLLDLIDIAWQEQAALNSSFNANTFKKSFDSSCVAPVSGLFIGGSLAFSPHDTGLFINITLVDRGESGVDSLAWEHRYAVDSVLVYDSAKDATLISGIVGGDRNLDFHLPFDSTWPSSHMPDDYFWGLWMQNNLDSLLLASSPDALIGVDMRFDVTPEVKFGYHNQTLAFIDALTAEGHVPVVQTYNGYSGNPATDGQYLYDIMREWLIFHSNIFQGVEE